MALRTGRRPTGTALGAVAALAVLAAGCSGGSDSSSPTTPTINFRHEAGERAVAAAVNRVWRSLLAVHGKATRGGGGPAMDAPGGATLDASGQPAPGAAGGPSAVGSACAATLTPPAIAAGATGSLTANSRAFASALAADEVDCAEVTVRYYAADGREQPLYNPLTTTRVTAAGTCRVSGTAVSIDVVFDDMQASAPSLVANGTAQTVYESTTVTAELRSLRVPKQTCAYPTSGQIVARAAEITVTVAFDGSATATGTYSWSGLGATFAIPLTGCTP